MTKLPFESVMTTSGIYAFPKVSAGKRRILELSGGFGGGTATVGYVSPSGAFIAYKVSTGGASITATAEESWVVDTPATGQFAISLSGATGASLKLTATPIL